MQIESSIKLIDDILNEWKEIIGDDFEGYKNHVYRMVNYCFVLRKCTLEERKKIIIAGCFHDIGIWTEKTIDYISPSVLAANQYLSENDLLEWKEEIGLMIKEHHKLNKCDNNELSLVETFRKGDLVDFSLGLIKSGVPKSFIKNIKNEIPNSGFHLGLIKKIGPWLLRNPLNPAPMFKW